MDNVEGCMQDFYGCFFLQIFAIFYCDYLTVVFHMLTEPTTNLSKAQKLIEVQSLLDKFKVTSEHVLIIGHCPLR